MLFSTVKLYVCYLKQQASLLQIFEVGIRKIKENEDINTERIRICRGQGDISKWWLVISPE